eukprot:scaffold23809_cov62-Cyclotella_meneghiniana.AAC.11
MKLEIILSISTICLAAATKDLSSAQSAGSNTHFELASVGLISGDSSASGANWYPDWTSGDDNCKADGKAPEYMVINSDTWLSNDRTDCCTRYFGYRLNDCLGSAVASNGTNLFFPDWSGSEGCVKDNGNTRAPGYIANQGTAYMYDSLDDCCANHYSWNLEGCLGSTDIA